MVELENKVILMFKSNEWAGCNLLSEFAAPFIDLKVCRFSSCANCYQDDPNLHFPLRWAFHDEPE